MAGHGRNGCWDGCGWVSVVGFILANATPNEFFPLPLSYHYTPRSYFISLLAFAISRCILDRRTASFHPSAVACCPNLTPIPPTHIYALTYNILHTYTLNSYSALRPFGQSSGAAAVPVPRSFFPTYIIPSPWKLNYCLHAVLVMFFLPLYNINVVDQQLSKAILTKFPSRRPPKRVMVTA